MKLVSNKLLFLGAFVVLSYQAMSQATHVQTATLFQTGTSVNVIVPFTAQGSTTGNTIIAHITYSGQTNFITGVADSRGNTYQKAAGPTNWNGAGCWRSELWYSYNITGGSFPITVAATLNAAPANVCTLQYMQMYISEFTGMLSVSNPFDKTSSAANNSTNPNSGAQTTGFANELIYGASIGGTLGTITQGAGFTSASGANNNRIEFRNLVAASSISAAFLASPAGTWVADMATFKTTGIALPIVLNGFEASAEKAGKVRVEWSTQTEVNNDYFELQRSRDGFDWSVIQKAKGAGNSTSPKFYEFTDVNPYAGLNYYRLNQVDFDGKTSLSKVIKVETLFTPPTGVKEYPNPVTDWMNLEGSAEELDAISIFSVYGENMNHKITETQMKNSGLSLNLSPLGSGIYFIKTKTGYLKILKR